MAVQPENWVTAQATELSGDPNIHRYFAKDCQYIIFKRFCTSAQRLLKSLESVRLYAYDKSGPGR
jgi:hypothetical protein